METIKHQQGTMNKSSQSIFLKMATVVSVSIFSLLFFCSFSSYAIQIAHNIDKRYMFLLCNGILVLIVKNSAGLIDNLQQESDHDLPGKKDLKKGHHAHQAEVFNSLEQKQSIKEVAQETQNLSTSVCKASSAEEQEEQDNANEDNVNMAADHQDDQEDSSGLPSVDEFNKKCDDFIRKKWKEIRSRHLTFDHGLKVIK